VEWPAEAIVPAALEAPLQSILAELVRNVRKHASPTRTVLRIAVADETLELALTNDGVRERRSLPGAGLQLAAFDALRVGGTLTLGPHDDGTWRVTVLIPIEIPRW
jgi:signal transduction histidine kinase